MWGGFAGRFVCEFGFGGGFCELAFVACDVFVIWVSLFGCFIVRCGLWVWVYLGLDLGLLYFDCLKLAL